MTEPRAATAAEIREILGPVDEALLAELARLGATSGEVLEAFTRLSGDESAVNLSRGGLSARVAAVMRVLEAAELPRDDRD